MVITDVNGTLHDGNYTLVVSNDFGSVTSSPTSLQVDGTPTNHSVASIGMQMIFCPPGTFTMGSPSSETGRGGDETQHQVTLTNGFYLGKYELTQAQYETVMNGNSEGLNTKPSEWPNNDDRPVEKVSWEDAQVFLSRLNSIEQTAGRLPNGWKYVLPTEAEWEHAARGGLGEVRFPWGEDEPDDDTNFPCNIWQGRFPKVNTCVDGFTTTAPVCSFEPNPWGLYNLIGNVWEWTADPYRIRSLKTSVKTRLSKMKGYKTSKGGSFLCHRSYCYRYRIAARSGISPDSSTSHQGFRVVWPT